jgi:polysaccharide biosynthesis/export protein
MAGVAAGEGPRTRDSHTPVETVSAATENKGETSSESFRARDSRYQVQPGDSMEVQFELTPEFNQTVTVQPDGYITLRGVGDLHIASLTVPELTDTLRKSYSSILHDPRITIALKDFQKPYFVADGQVARPGRYDLRGNTSLTQAIATAGGFLDSAKHSRVFLYRQASGGWVAAQVIDVKKMEKDGDLHEDPLLHPGDMLFVPKNRFSKIKQFIPGSSISPAIPF